MAGVGLNIGLYVGSNRSAEAHNLANTLEKKGHLVVIINAEEPNTLDLSVNGVPFYYGEADRAIKKLLE
jgi:hypothetical protein